MLKLTLKLVLVVALMVSTAWGDIFTLGGPPASGYSITGRARNGNTGFEGVLFTPAHPSPSGLTLNPAGAPIWNTGGNHYGDYFNFLFTYTASTGTTVWAIDFNHDNDYLDSQESATSVSPTLAGQGFGKVNLFLQGNGTVGAYVQGFTLNGTPFGPFSNLSATALEQTFTNSGVIDGNITATGQVTFTGAGSSEIPRMWLRAGDLVAVPVAVPDGGTTLALLGGALTGLAAFRRKFGV